jgi:DNA-binding CsgD family transcriptional regulator
MWAEPSPLVAREREVARLLDALAAARQGRGGVALVSGEAGIGKTRLLIELAERGRRDGWHVLVGRAYELEGRPPYLPVLEALRDGLRTQPQLDLELDVENVAPELLNLLPALAPRTQPQGRPGASTAWPVVHDHADPARDRFRLFESVCDVLLAIAHASRAGLLLALDDLHWADPPTLQLVLHFARKLEYMPVLLVCAYRVDASHAQAALQSVLAELGRERLHQRVELRALARDELAPLVAGLAGETDASALDMIHARSGGNPFFACELVRHLQDRGHDLSRGDLASADWGVPASVHHVVSMRLARLSPTAIDLLQASSVIGDPLHANVLATMLGLDPAELLDACDEVVRTGLLREEGDHFQFSHALVRETVYRGLTLARRQRLHLAAVRAFERVYAAVIDRHLGELAVHAAQAGILIDRQIAIDYAERAGSAANAVFAYEEAVAHWRAALRQLEAQPESSDQRAYLLERIGELTYQTGIDYAAGIGDLERALQLYTSLNQPLQAARVHARLGSALASLPETWDLPRAVEHYRRAEAGLSEAGPSAALGAVYVGMAQVAIWNVDIAAGLDASARALDLAEQLADERLWAQAAAVRGGHLCSAGAVGEGLPLMHAAWQTADRLNDTTAFFAAFLGSAFAHWFGDAAEFKLWCERELGRPRVREAPGQRQRFVARLASAYALTGELEAARALLGTAAVSYDAWDALFWLGNWQQCEALASQRISASQRGGDRAFAFEATYDLARVHWIQGKAASAGHFLEQALTVAVDGGERSYELAVRCLLVQVCVEARQFAAARAHLDRAHAIAGTSDQWRGLAGQVALADGAAALAEHSPVSAERDFTQASAIFRRFGHPWGEAEAQLLWGRGLRTLGDTASAERHLRAAADIYRGLGAGAMWLERVPVAPQPAMAGVALGGLSAREVDVLRLLAAGQTNRQIADALVISSNTVASHVSHIFAKTGVANRAEATSYAHRMGIL